MDAQLRRGGARSCASRSLGYSFIHTIPSPSSASRWGDPTVSTQITVVDSVGRWREMAAAEGLHPLHERLLRAGGEQDHAGALGKRIVAQRARQREQHGHTREVVVGARAPPPAIRCRPLRPCSRRSRARRSCAASVSPAARRRPPQAARRRRPTSCRAWSPACPSRRGTAARSHAAARGERPVRSARHRGGSRAPPCAPRRPGRSPPPRWPCCVTAALCGETTASRPSRHRLRRLSRPSPRSRRPRARDSAPASAAAPVSSPIGHQ